MKRNFQTLVIFHQILIFAAMAVQSVTDSWLPPEIRTFLGIERSVIQDMPDVMPQNQILDTLWWAIIFLSMIASVGLVLFRQWGRTLFMLASVFNLLLTPLEWLYVDVGWTVMVASASYIVEGMIISLIFFSPLRRLFRR